MARWKKRPSKAPDDRSVSPPPEKRLKEDEDQSVTPEIEEEIVERDDHEEPMQEEKAIANEASEGESDNNDDDDDDDDDEAKSTISNNPLRSVNPAGRPAEAGVIKKVYVQDFMCHRKLTVDLCRNVNFIHGQNGSGKSAVLAAIQICLGAGARRTHRARNLKDLIRKEAGSDCSGSRVRVTLLNGGDDGFERSKYGDEITVERCISRTGYNGYKILDVNGKERSRSKKDLDTMLDQLNIQVENPVAVLDQEEAKKFLTGKPEDKYAFFSKATELERIDRSYAAVVDNVTDLEDTKERVRGSMQTAVDNVKKLEQEYKESQELGKLEEKVADYKITYAWSCYNSLLAKAQEQENIANELKAKHTKRVQELTKAESAANVTHDEETHLRERLALLTKEAEEAATAKTELENELRNAVAPVKVHERDLNGVKREIHGAKRRHVAAQKRLKEARDQIMAAAGNAKSEEAKRTKSISETEGKIAEAKNTLVQQKEEIATLLKQYEELEPNVEQAKSDCSGVTSQLHVVTKKLKELQSSAENSLAVFGQKCVAMHAKVEQAKKARRFRGPVVGPIGAHIKIAQGKEQYAKIAEHAIGGGTFDRFIVTNDDDRQLYMKLRREIGCSSRDCGVFQMPVGPRYNVPPPPCPEVETVVSVLNVTDDLVFNCLVDNVKIDLRALAVSKEVSERALLVENANGREEMRGGLISQVFFLPNGDYWQLRDGYRTMISNDGHSLRQTIGIDRTAAIESTQREVNLLKTELNECRSREAQILQESKSVKLRWNEKNRASRETVKLIDKLQNTLDALHAEADAAENITIDTTEFEEDVKTAEEALEQLQEKETDYKNSIRELKPAVEDAKKRLEEITMRNEKVLSDITAAEQKIEDYVKGQAHRQAVVEKKRKKVQQIEVEVQKQNDVIKDLREKKDDSMQKARLLTHRRQHQRKNGKKDDNDEAEHDQSPSTAATPMDLDDIEPIPTPRDPSYYKAKIERFTQQIEREREHRRISERDPEVLLEKYLRAKESLNSKVSSIEKIEVNINKLVADIKDRRKRWKQFRKHIGDMTDNTFDEILNKKGSSGKIDFDHQEKKLNLVVQKDNTNEMSQTKDVKALSGGERSFTTLALLLALGENLETPFRVMDEFDVFLDPQSRKIALDTMVDVARDMEHRQFIFITPQDLSTLKPHHMLKITYLKAPKRNAVVGGPTQQTLNFTSPG